MDEKELTNGERLGVVGFLGDEVGKGEFLGFVL